VIEAVFQTCDGFAATIVGTDDDDDIVGTNGIDVIVGLGGGDRIAGLGGDDIVCGGDGDDDLLGGDGADRLLGDVGNDVLEGNAGDDFCDGVSGVDSASLDCEVRENVDTEVFPVTLFADDGVQLDGALYVPTDDALKPGGKYRKLAMIVSHGAMGSFDSSMPKIMGLQASPLGFTVLALNRRDWGPTGGGGAVLFEDATLDLGVGIRLLNEMGYDAIYVCGHSQGTNNAAIYPSFSLDPTVAGVGLYGTVDDGRDTARNLLFNPDNVSPGYPELVVKAELLVSMGKGDDVIQWDTAFGQPLFRSPANFLSYWGPDSLSVVEREITKLDVPALLMRAEGDQFTPDEMSQNVLNAALAADVDAVYEILNYPYDPGAFGGNAHGFVRVEREMMATTLEWLIDRVPQASQYTKDIQVTAP
jgi:pimeloyl-ACP methyl ester carboxylesterase